MRYPAFFLVGGVCSIFGGFVIGICLYYGLAVAGILALVVLIAVIFFECFWAKGQSDNYSALNLALGALFFRSCLPDLGAMSDNHHNLNLPPLPPSKEEKEKEEKEKEEKDMMDEKEKEKEEEWSFTDSEDELLSDAITILETPKSAKPLKIAIRKTHKKAKKINQYPAFLWERKIAKARPI